MMMFFKPSQFGQICYYPIPSMCMVYIPTFVGSFMIFMYTVNICRSSSPWICYAQDLHGGFGCRCQTKGERWLGVMAVTQP